jgi:hypothetical protein
MVIRSSQVPADDLPGTERTRTRSGSGRLSCSRASGGAPGSLVRPIRAQLHVGQPGHNGCKTTSLPQLQDRREAP